MILTHNFDIQVFYDILFLLEFNGGKANIYALLHLLKAQIRVDCVNFELYIKYC